MTAAARGARQGGARGRVVVVGAGLGGLACAVRLAAAGCEVTILERDLHPGGRAGRRVHQGFSFDLGPSVLTMPELIGDVFEAAGEQAWKELHIERLDPAYRAVFHDGSQLSIRAGVESTAREIASVAGRAQAAGFLGLCRHLTDLYEATFDGFIDGNFDSPLDLLRPRRLARLARLGGFGRVHGLVRGHVDDWRLVRLFTFQSMYAGMSPWQALGVYAVIAYMDVVRGVYGVRGGIYAVSEALAALARRTGAELRLGTAAERVDVVSGRAVAVRTSAGERLSCDAVVLNADLPIAYRDLLPAEATPRRVRRLRYSPSCVVVHLGLDRPPAGAAHHNIHFARNYRASFDDLLAGRLQRDPSWFLSVPTVTDPALAPPGGAVAFYLLPAPNLHDARIDWDRQAAREGELALERLEGAGYGDLARAVRVCQVVTPADWAAQGMAAGTPFAASHHFFQTGPWRPRNLAPKVGRVVFAGSGTTPGVGVPMVLISGKLAAQRVLALLTDARRQPAGV